jgi:hypothetical protein
MKTILVFIDGLGWGPQDPATNPCLSYGGDVFRLPAWGGEPARIGHGGWAVPLDAVLGVAGIPQSATGQTTLLAGVNAQGLIGKHLSGFPNEPLRHALLETSLLKVLTDGGLRARFVNGYRPLFWELPRERQLTLSASTVANLAADLPFMALDDVVAGRSVYHDFTNEELIRREFDVPRREPAEAGRVLGRLHRDLDFSLYEYFLSDKAGHTGDHATMETELAKIDAFLGGLLDEIRNDLAADTLVLLTSDHGNLEDATTRRHTTNPVPLMAWGDGAREFVAPLTGLDQVAGAVARRHGL